MAKDNSIGVNHIFAFLLGTTIGVGAGLMLAPKSGKDLGGDISDKAKDTKDKLAETIDNGREAAKSRLSSILDMSKNVATESTRAAKQAKNRIQEEN